MRKAREDTNWHKSQEQIKEHFESLGANARTNIKIHGACESHDIDVLVNPKFLGKEMIWIVEAKNWSTNVPKEKVMALLSIVQDLGADRGSIISNKGFQKGAINSVKNTNITLANFEEFKESNKDFVNTEVIKHYEARLKILHTRYWSHPKRTRRDYELRHDLLGLSPFSDTTLLGHIQDVLLSIKSKSYPINTNTGLEINIGEKEINGFHQACNWLNLNLNLLDQKLLKAEMKMMKNGDFNPNFERWAMAFE